MPGTRDLLAASAPNIKRSAPTPSDRASDHRVTSISYHFAEMRTRPSVTPALGASAFDPHPMDRSPMGPSGGGDVDNSLAGSWMLRMVLCL
ncbi:hypothetical protein ZHAS_00015725 [Anopheles sinensis]|uniref:Uncharacterized protein n=1 Tax=Anopheles sinensis TaxID=74873 RepID=A0A084WBN3_ANOSI|nr:hypothetical protein ZHAS_00015725 [Anopheles sinensis]